MTCQLNVLYERQQSEEHIHYALMTQSARNVLLKILAASADRLEVASAAYECPSQS